MKLMEVFVAGLLLAFAYQLYHNTATAWYAQSHELIAVLEGWDERQR